MIFVIILYLIQIYCIKSDIFPQIQPICENSKFIYSLLSNSCEQCHENCGSCYGILEKQCRDCKQNLYLNQINQSCVEQCPEGTFAEINKKNCIKCLVKGCIECDSDQNCFQCQLPLQLVDNQCILPNNTCKVKSFYEIQNNNCQYSCMMQETEDTTTNLCQDISYCLQINESLELNGNDIIYDTSLFRKLSNNLYLSIKQKCTFYVYNEQLMPLYKKELIPELSYTNNKIYFPHNQGFILNDIGYCFLQDQLIIGYNFVTSTIAFKQERNFLGMPIYKFYEKEFKILLTISSNEIHTYDIQNDKMNLITRESKSFLYFSEVPSFKKYPTFIWNNEEYIKIKQFDEKFNDRSMKEISQKKSYSFKTQKLNDQQVIVFIDFSEQRQKFYILTQDSLNFDIILETNFNFKGWAYNSQKNILTLANINSMIYMYYLDAINYSVVKTETIKIEDLSQISILDLNFEIYLIKDAKNNLYFYKTEEDKQNNKLNFILKTKLILNGQDLKSLKVEKISENIFSYLIYYGSNAFIKKQIDISIPVNYINENLQSTFELYRSNLSSQLPLQMYSNINFPYIGFIQNEQKSSLNFFIVEKRNGEPFYRFTQRNLLYPILSQGKINLYKFSKITLKNKIKYILCQTDDTFTNYLQLCLYSEQTCQYLFSGQSLVDPFIETSNSVYFCNFRKLLDIDSGEVIDLPIVGVYQSIKCYNVNDEQIYIILNNKKVFEINITQKSSNVVYEDQIGKVKSILSNQYQAVLINDNIYFNLDNTYTQFSLQTKKFNIQNTYENRINQDTFYVKNPKQNQMISLTCQYIHLFDETLSHFEYVQLSDKNQKCEIKFIKEYIFIALMPVIFKFNTITSEVLYKHNFYESTFLNNDTYPLLLEILYSKELILYQYSLIHIETFEFFSFLGHQMKYFKLNFDVMQNYDGKKLEYSLFSSINDFWIQENIQNIASLRVDFLDRKYISYSKNNNNIKIISVDASQPKVYIFDKYKQNYQEIDLISKYDHMMSDLVNNIIVTFKNELIKTIYFNQPKAEDKYYDFKIKQNQSVTKALICPMKQKIVFNTNDNKMFCFDYMKQEIQEINISQVQDSITTKILLDFQVSCTENFIAVTSPFIQIYDFQTLKKHSFQITTPIISVEKKTVFYAFSSYGQFILRDDFAVVSLLFNYVRNETRVHYDYKEDYLLVLNPDNRHLSIHSWKKQIIVYSYFSEVAFNKEGYLFDETEQMIIIQDYLFQIHFVDYAKFDYNMSLSLDYYCQGMYFLKQKNLLFIWSNYKITILDKRDLQIQDIISNQDLINNPASSSQIMNVLFHNYDNSMVVIRTDSIMTYDLEQIIYKTPMRLYSMSDFNKSFFLALGKGRILFACTHTRNLHLYQDGLKISQMMFFDSISIESFRIGQIFLLDQKNLEEKDISYVIYIIQNCIILVKVDLKSISLIKNYTSKVAFDYYLYDSINNQIIIATQPNQIYSLSINEWTWKEIVINSQTIKFDRLQIYNQYLILQSKQSIIFLKLTDMETKDIQFNSEVSRVIKVNMSEKFKNEINSIQNFQESELEKTNQYDDQNQDNLKLLVYSKDELKISLINIMNDQVIVERYINFSFEVMNIQLDYTRSLMYISQLNGLFQIYNIQIANMYIELISPSLTSTRSQFHEQIYFYVYSDSQIDIYNAISYKRELPPINKGFREIISINSLSNQYRDVFLIIERTQISVIRVDLTQAITDKSCEYELLFQRKQSYTLFLIDFSITLEDSQLFKGQLRIHGVSIQNLVDYSIPFSVFKKQINQKSSDNVGCLFYVESQNFQIQQIYYLQKINKVIQEMQIQVKAISVQLKDGQILFPLIFEQGKTKIQSKVSFFSDDIKSQILWNDNSLIAQTSTVGILQISNMTLMIQDIFLEPTSTLQTVILQNLNIKMVSCKFSLKGVKNVIIEKINFSFDFQQRGLQCKSNFFEITGSDYVIIEDLTIESQKYILDKFSSIFNITNVDKLILKNLIVKDTSLTRPIFDLSYTQSVDIKDVQVINTTLNQTYAFRSKFVYRTQVFNMTVRDSSKLNFFLLQGCTFNNFTNISVLNSANINGWYLLADEDLVIHQSYDLRISDILISDVSNYFSSISSRQTIIDNLIMKNLTYIQENITSGYQIQFIWNIQDGEIKIRNSSFSQIFLYENSISKDNIESNSVTKFILQLVSVYGTLLQNLVFFRNSGSLILIKLSVNSQSVVLDNVYASYNENPTHQIIVANMLQLIFIMNSAFIQNKSNKDGGAISLYGIPIVQLSNTIFKGNKCLNGKGGAMYFEQIQYIKISNSHFFDNESYKNSGGAIYLYRLDSIADLIIQTSYFIGNKAQQDKGGAIFLSNINLISADLTIQQNIAAIGGGIFYEIVIPDLIRQWKDEILLNNITQNKAYVYGNNFGSFVRQIKVQEENQTLRLLNNIQQRESSYVIRNMQSGGYIYLSKLVLIDEEGSPIVYDENDFQQSNNQNLFKSELIKNQLNPSVQDFISSIALALDSDSISIRGGSIARYNSQIKGFSFNTTLSFSPGNSSSFQVKLNNKVPFLLDSKGKEYSQSKELTLQINVEFRNCLLGEIKQQVLGNVVCLECQEGKYSLNINDTQCSICPASAIKCFGSNILLENGYWRQHNLTDQIIRCNNQPLNCLAQEIDSINYCKKGYKGPLCEECDVQGEVWGDKYASSSMYQCGSCENKFALTVFRIILVFCLMFGYIYFSFSKFIQLVTKQMIGYYLKRSQLLFIHSSIYKGDTSKFTRILISHLQIISITSSFSIPLPQSFRYFSDIGGNPVSLTSNNAECFDFYQSIMNGRAMPLWFIKTLTSLVTPIAITVLFTVYILRQYFNTYRNLEFMKWKIFMIYIYLYFYPQILILLANSFRCRQIGNESFLSIDLNIVCNDYTSHSQYTHFFNIPMLVIWIFIIPSILYYNLLKNLQNNSSYIDRSQYYILINGLKKQYYYWMFIELALKAFVMFISIVFYEQIVLKALLIIIMLVLFLYFQMAIQPYQGDIYNRLESQSILLNIITLTICIIYQSSSSSSLFKEVQEYLIYIINLYYMSKLALLIFIKPISPKKENRNQLEDIIFNIKKKYPMFFRNIQIYEKPAWQTLIKMKLLFKMIAFLGHQQIQNQVNSSLAEKFKQTQIISTRRSGFLRSRNDFKLSSKLNHNGSFDNLDSAKKCESNNLIQLVSPFAKTSDNMFMFSQDQLKIKSKQTIMSDNQGMDNQIFSEQNNFDNQILSENQIFSDPQVLSENQIVSDHQNSFSTEILSQEYLKSIKQISFTDSNAYQDGKGYQKPRRFSVKESIFSKIRKASNPSPLYD